MFCADMSSKATPPNHHRKARSQFAAPHVDKRFLSRFLQLNEAKMNVFSHTNQCYFFQENRTISAVKHGGDSIILWGYSAIE